MPPFCDLTIISGIGPNSSGTGLLMQGLVEEGSTFHSTKFIFRQSYKRGIWGLICRTLNKVKFRWTAGRVARTSPEVMIFHPQTIGLPLLQEIIESRVHTWIYILDASSFCLRSYNCLPIESTPCLRCVGNDGSAARVHGCVNWFRSGNFQEYMTGWVRSGKLKLIAQCETHAQTLRAHFGAETTIAIVPLTVPDITLPATVSTLSKRPRPRAVYHGACNHAKGVAHVIALAQLMPDWDFVIPSSRQELTRHYGQLESYPANLILESMSWTSGLADAVRLADIVLCPSSWSAPIEGAVLKSMAHNGLVGLYVHDTSFAKEIPPSARVMIDPLNLPETVKRLRHLAQNPSEATAIRLAARQYIQAYAHNGKQMLRSLRKTCGLG